jgi:hypothetical protein
MGEEQGPGFRVVCECVLHIEPAERGYKMPKEALIKFGTRKKQVSRLRRIAQKDWAILLRSK